MNKEMKFRGLSKKGWLYGMPTYDFFYIFNKEQLDSADNYRVKPETVGQFTGLQDANGVDIFGGDILETPKGYCTVTYDLGCFYTISVSKYRLGGWKKSSIKVIANIHQNPELLSF
jgi:YopX protein